jgi:hypothetical protein
MAIFALVIVGVLVAAAFFVGRQEQLLGRNTIRLQQAFAAAEAGAELQAATWDPQVLNRLAEGDTLGFSGTLPGSGWYRGAVLRLNPLLFLIRSEGFSPDSTARQRVGLLVRLRPVEVDVRAALETAGRVDLADAAALDGADHAPSDWLGCPPLAAAVPGLRVPEPGMVTTASGCTGLSCVSGAPPLEADTTVTPATLAVFEGVAFDSLRALATKVVPAGSHRIAPTVTGGQCSTSDPDNWGAPLQPSTPCGGYFPIVWADGDLSINGAQGQGVLLVDGDLSLQGSFEFYGAIVVRGSVRSDGTGARITGGMVVIDGGPTPSQIHGNTRIQYSRCALDRARGRSARVSLLKERSWVNLY